MREHFLLTRPPRPPPATATSTTTTSVTTTTTAAAATAAAATAATAGAGLAAPKAVTKSAEVGAAEGELTAALRRLLLDFHTRGYVQPQPQPRPQP